MGSGCCNFPLCLWFESCSRVLLSRLSTSFVDTAAEMRVDIIIVHVFSVWFKYLWGPRDL